MKIPLHNGYAFKMQIQFHYFDVTQRYQLISVREGGNYIAWRIASLTKPCGCVKGEKLHLVMLQMQIQAGGDRMPIN